MKTIRVKSHHENSGHCTTTFKAVDTVPDRYYNRIKGSNGDGCWCTVWPVQGYWESDTPVRDDFVFEVVDDDGNVLFTESNASLGAYASVSKKAREMAAEITANMSLKPYEEWKSWLAADMEKHGYSGYVENWLYAESGNRGCTQISRYKHLGMEFIICDERMDHIICGKEWRCVSIINARNNNCEALCGFIFN